MTTDHDKGLGSGLLFEDALPLTWQIVGADAAHAHADEGNQRFLNILSLIEDHQPDTRADESGEMAKEIVRLDAKINLLIDLVARILAQQVSLPPPVPTRLSADGIEWSPPAQAEGGGMPQAGDRLLLKLYLRPEYPVPLFLFCRVTRLDRAADWIRIEARFEDLLTPVRDLLERTIFRRHRRVIAGQREKNRQA